MSIGQLQPSQGAEGRGWDTGAKSIASCLGGRVLLLVALVSHSFQRTFPELSLSSENPFQIKIYRSYYTYQLYLV